MPARAGSPHTGAKCPKAHNLFVSMPARAGSPHTYNQPETKMKYLSCPCPLGQAPLTHKNMEDVTLPLQIVSMPARAGSPHTAVSGGVGAQGLSPPIPRHRPASMGTAPKYAIGAEKGNLGDTVFYVLTTTPRHSATQSRYKQYINIDLCEMHLFLLLCRGRLQPVITFFHKKAEWLLQNKLKREKPEGVIPALSRVQPARICAA